MADLPSRLDLFALGRNYIRVNTKRLDPYQVDVGGSDLNIVAGVSAQLAYFLVLQLAFSINRLLLDGAEGEDLDRYAYDRYTLTRPGAAAAVVSLSFARQTSTGGPGTIASGTRVRTTSGIEYVTTTDASFGSLDLVSSADARAEQAGKAFQVGANLLTTFSDPTSIFDKSITVTNPVAAAGGEEVLSDDLFRGVIRKFWKAARRGVLSAIEFGALLVPGVTSAQAIEGQTVVAVQYTLNSATLFYPTVSQAFPARIVNLYISDSTGVANQTLANLVRIQLGDYRAAGITVIVNASAPQIVSIALALTFAANINTVALTQAIQAAVLEYVNTLPVNGTLMLSGLYAVLQRFGPQGLIVNSSTVASPVGDLQPAIGQTIRTTLANITVS
jgi:uncharacterized phage protein gp47/JayE